MRNGEEVVTESHIAKMQARSAAQEREIERISGLLSAFQNAGAQEFWKHVENVLQSRIARLEDNARENWRKWTESDFKAHYAEVEAAQMLRIMPRAYDQGLDRLMKENAALKRTIANAREENARYGDRDD